MTSVLPRTAANATPSGRAAAPKIASPGSVTRWAVSLRARRLMAATATVVAIAVFVVLHERIAATLGHASVYSGATLLGSLVVLMLIGARKRLVMLPLWSVSCWLQIHIYTGLFASVVFVLHVPRIVASGWFEGGLSWLFLVVSGSGFYGLYACRVLPKRLTALSVQPRFDRIDWHRSQLSSVADSVFDDLSDSSDAAVLNQFYQRSLKVFFSSDRSRLFLLWPSAGRRRRLLAELGDLRRYLGPQSLMAADRLAALVRQRDELDYHEALQFRLRAWVAIHAALATVLLVWSLVHAALAVSMIG
jgi:hypothetical protein